MTYQHMLRLYRTSSCACALWVAAVWYLPQLLAIARLVHVTPRPPSPHSPAQCVTTAAPMCQHSYSRSPNSHCTTTVIAQSSYEG
jgi:hypothetical protein